MGRYREGLASAIEEMMKNPAGFHEFERRRALHFETEAQKKGISVDACIMEWVHAPYMFFHESWYFAEHQDICVTLDNLACTGIQTPEDIDDYKKRGKTHAHRHEFFEMFYVFKGMCYGYIDGVEHAYFEGDIGILNMQSNHSIVLPDNDTILVNILVRKRAVKDTILSMIRENDLFMDFFVQSIFIAEATSKRI